MNTKITPILIVSIVAVLLLVCGAFFTMGGIVNTGSSITPGLYWKVDKPLSIGRAVVFCPPNSQEFQEARKRGYILSGSCPDNFDKMILKVAAKFKNSLTINDQGVFINDIPYPHSKPLAQDRNGRLMPVLNLNHYELKKNEVLLMSDSEDEPFDGRYFSFIDVEQIDSVISPIFNK